MTDGQLIVLALLAGFVGGLGGTLAGLLLVVRRIKNDPLYKQAREMNKMFTAFGGGFPPPTINDDTI